MSRFFLDGGILTGGFCPGGYCPDTHVATGNVRNGGGRADWNNAKKCTEVNCLITLSHSTCVCSTVVITTGNVTNGGFCVCFLKTYSSADRTGSPQGFHKFKSHKVAHKKSIEHLIICTHK